LRRRSRFVGLAVGSDTNRLLMSPDATMELIGTWAGFFR
jgi:hypothetical protein